MSSGDDIKDILAAAKVRNDRFNRDVNPLLGSLPEWVSSYRPHQKDAVEEILEAFGSNDLVILDAPTGSGKTLIAETVRKLGEFDSTLYVCNSKGLQQQFIKDYPYAKLLQGRSNYPTQRYPERFLEESWIKHLSCDDCQARSSKASCEWCEEISSCPYIQAKQGALSSSLAVVNTAYFLTEANGPGGFSGRELVVCDEADTLERELMNYVSVDISESRLAKLGLKPPRLVTVQDSWAEWLNEAIPALDKYLETVSRRSPKSTVQEREIRSLRSLKSGLRRVQAGLELSDSTWVYAGDSRSTSVSFKPATVAREAGRYLWRHGGKWLLMSGSVISAQEIVESLGWEKDYEVIKVGYSFPIENRPIFVRPIVDMSKKGQDGNPDQWRVLKAEISRILHAHEGQSVLVHTHTYSTTRELAKEDWGRPTYSYDDSRTRDDVVRRYINGGPGSVLFAPSLDRGLDLPDDLCRVQILVKVPHAYLGDRQVSARLYSSGGKLWYSAGTARTLIQMTGRGVRHKDDHCTTYILDRQFVSFYNSNKYLFPEWWSSSIQWRS